MDYNPDIHRRRSIRARGYDYTRGGAYFVTIVVQGRLCLFGSVVDEEMVLSDAGRMVRLIWEALVDRFPVVELDGFVVMPKHVHGVIFIREPLAVADATGEGMARGGPMLGEVVGAFKSVTTLEYGIGVREKGWRPYDRRLWQRNYFERVVRNERELSLIEEYIANNAVNWESDGENPSGSLGGAGRWDSPWEGE